MGSDTMPLQAPLSASIRSVESLLRGSEAQQQKRPRARGTWWRPVLITILAQGIVFGLAVLDYRTGTRFQFAFIYVIPVAFAALLGGVTSGTITALTSTVAWCTADLLVGATQEGGWLLYWNGFSRLSGFFLIVILLARSRELNRRLSEKAQGLSLEIERRKRTERVYADEKEILQQVARDAALIDILEALTRKIERWYEGTLCSIFLFDPDNSRLSRAIGPNLPKELRQEIQEKSLQEALAAEPPPALAGEAPFWDLLSAPAWADFRRLAGHAQLNPRCSKAILSGTGELLGLLVIFSPRDNGATLSDLALFEKARDIAAIAIERSRLSKEMRKLSELIIEAQEAERRRIARDLHDSVNQVLSSVTFRIGMVESRLGGTAAEEREELQKTRAILTRTTEEIHRISDDLRPSELDALGLVAAIRSLGDDFQSKTKRGLRFECHLPVSRLPDALELTLYRIIQEALNNIEKHSGASQAVLRLDCDGQAVELRIQDNGHGLEPASERIRHGRKSGMGLLNMRERAAFLGGSFAIHSPEGKGAEIVVRIPLGAEKGTHDHAQ